MSIDVISWRLNTVVGMQDLSTLFPDIIWIFALITEFPGVLYYLNPRQ